MPFSYCPLSEDFLQYVHSDDFKLFFWKRALQCSHGEGCEKCCWIWHGPKMHTPSGSYGQISMKYKEDHITFTAHRLSWILAYGDIQNGLLVCHNCPGGDNPSCVNFHHFFLGTH